MDRKSKKAFYGEIPKMIKTQNLSLEEIKELQTQLKTVKKEKIAEKRHQKALAKAEKVESKVNKCALTIEKKLISLYSYGYSRKQITKLISQYLVAHEPTVEETEK